MFGKSKIGSRRCITAYLTLISAKLQKTWFIRAKYHYLHIINAIIEATGKHKSTSEVL
uniref:Uncharacterized protein n=1 Tax=uncultured bacterium contig00149 TaxID=1181588 RepID=A0A806K0P4_9BACT|nr:hypothetical protein [uncultured bacterium contig00149]